MLLLGIDIFQRHNTNTNNDHKATRNWDKWKTIEKTRLKKKHLVIDGPNNRRFQWKQHPFWTWQFFIWLIKGWTLQAPGALIIIWCYFSVNSSCFFFPSHRRKKWKKETFQRIAIVDKFRKYSNFKEISIKKPSLCIFWV